MMPTTLPLNDLQAPEPGMLLMGLGNAKLLIQEDAIRVRRLKTKASLRIPGKGVFCHLLPEDTDLLLDLVPQIEETPKPKGPKWEKGHFEVHQDGGMRQVYGWRRDGWGIPLYWVEDESIVCNEWRVPTTSLTQLKTGKAVMCLAVGKAKALALDLDQSVPALAKADDPESDLSYEQKQQIQGFVRKYGG